MANDVVAGIMTNQVYSVYDAGKPQVADALMRKYGYQNQGLFGTIRSMSREAAVPASTFSGYEDQKFHRVIHVRTTIADPGAGSDAVFVLAAADLDTSNRFYLRVGDKITVPTAGVNNGVQAIVYSIDVSTPSAPSVTLKPTRAADNIGVLTANQALPITGGAFGAGTGQPDGTVVGVNKQTFYTQIFKESVGAEGDMLAQENWFEVYDTGENVTGYFNVGNLRSEYLLQLKIDGDFTVGTERTNTGLVVAAGQDGAGNAINTTRGVFPWAELNGYKLNYTPGSEDIEDLGDISDYMRTQYISSGNVMIMSGQKLARGFNYAARDYFVTDTGSSILTQIGEGAFGGVDNMKGVLNFKAFNLGDGFNYMLYTMDNWSNPETFNVTGLEFDKKGLVMPVSSFKDPNPQGTGQKVENFRTRYRAKGAYSRKYEMWSNGAAGGGQYIGDIDRRDWYLRAELGLEIYKCNQMVVVEPS